MLIPLVQTAPPPHSQTVYRIPYRLSDTKHIIVRVKLNGKGPFSFILDTGSPAFIISEGVGKKAGIPISEETWSAAPTVDIEGGLSLKDVKVRVWDPFQLKHMNAAGLADSDIAGVLGFSLIGRYRMDIDLKRRHMLWTDTGVDPQLPTPQEITGGKPIKPGAEVGSLDSMAANARAYLPKKNTAPARGKGFIGMEVEDSEAGIRVKAVFHGSPAAQAGIRPGDVIARASIGGPAELIEKSDRLIDLTSTLVGGKRLFLAIKRDNQALKLAIMAERAGL
jgi:hypothetical protein